MEEYPTLMQTVAHLLSARRKHWTFEEDEAVTTIVQGPLYEKDARKTDKYKPYQYVGLKTE